MKFSCLYWLSLGAVVAPSMTLDQVFENAQIQTIVVDDSIYMLEGNIGVFVGEDGVFLN